LLGLLHLLSEKQKSAAVETVRTEKHTAQLSPNNETFTTTSMKIQSNAFLPKVKTHAYSGKNMKFHYLAH